MWVCATCWRASCFFSSGERSLCGEMPKGVVMPYNVAAALKLEDSQTLSSERAAAYRGEYQLYGYKPADLVKYRRAHAKKEHCKECCHVHQKKSYCGCEVMVIADESKPHRANSEIEMRHCACMA